MRARTAGIPAPGSPACTVVRTPRRSRATPRSRAISARCSAYEGVQHTAVAPRVSMAASRCAESCPPPGIARAPRARAPSNPAQNPTNSPNENGKKMRSPGPRLAPRNTNPQQRAHHSHDSCVSSQRSGAPAVHGHDPAPDGRAFRENVLKDRDRGVPMRAELRGADEADLDDIADLRQQLVEQRQVAAALMGELRMQTQRGTDARRVP